MAKDKVEGKLTEAGKTVEASESDGTPHGPGETDAEVHPQNLDSLGTRTQEGGSSNPEQDPESKG